MNEQPFGLPQKPQSSDEESALAKAKQKLHLVRSAARDAFFDYQDDISPESPWEILADADRGKYDKTKALLMVLRGVVPDALFQRLTRGHYEYKPDVLAIDSERYQFEAKKLDGGGECSVYRLIAQDPATPNLVIKIDRTTKQNVDVLVKRGKQLREEYEEKREWYRDLPELIPEELQFIGKSPRGGRMSLFTIQEYLGSAEQIHDLFRGYSEDELVALLEADERLCQQFRIFSDITLQRVEEHDEMIDTLGNKNIAIVDRPEGQRLMLLDAHVVHHPKHPKNEDEGQRIQVNIDFLQRVLDRLDAGSK